MTWCVEWSAIWLVTRKYSVKSEKYNLVCIGGPESELLNNTYDKAHIFPLDAKEKINQFVRTVLAKDVKEEIDYKFFWHGLMGYTQSGLRVIGPEPCNGVLLYNLGCNGVGLMTSIYGGKRIAQFLLNRKLAPSVFDPFNQACLVK
jgi:glycine/D-amino acid oxidase-like deaminating enzyme